MATLEVHDGRGRVEFVTISREQPALFGSDPKCDIVLADPTALPYHGRLRWNKNRFKVDALPEAGHVEVDGKKVASASFRHGSELRVGSYRIFLVSPDEGAADLEKTRVQEMPPAAALR